MHADVVTINIIDCAYKVIYFLYSLCIIALVQHNSVNKCLDIGLSYSPEFRSYGAREGSSSVHLVLSWPRHIKSWERDNMSWPQDINSWEHHINSWECDIMLWPRERFVEVTTSISRGHDFLC